MHVRPYRPTDYPTILSWWQASNENPPMALALLEDGTFVVELDDGRIAATITVYLTKSPLATYFENACADRSLDKETRHAATEMAAEYGCKYAKDNGSLAVITYSKYEKLLPRYEALGFTTQVSGLYGLVRML